MYRLLAYVSFRNKGHRALLVEAYLKYFWITKLVQILLWNLNFLQIVSRFEMVFFDDPGIYK